MHTKFIKVVAYQLAPVHTMSNGCVCGTGVASLVPPYVIFFPCCFTTGLIVDGVSIRPNSYCSCPLSNDGQRTEYKEYSCCLVVHRNSQKICWDDIIYFGNTGGIIESICLFNKNRDDYLVEMAAKNAKDAQDREEKQNMMNELMETRSKIEESIRLLQKAFLVERDQEKKTTIRQNIQNMEYEMQLINDMINDVNPAIREVTVSGKEKSVDMNAIKDRLDIANKGIDLVMKFL